jgi:predicted Zn-dependent protease
VSTTTEPTGTLDVAMKHATSLLQGQPALAAEQAREILKVVPNHAPAVFLLARALAAQGRGDEAIAALRATLALKPDHPEAWRLLADHLVAIGDVAGADAAYNSHVRASTRNPDLQRAAVAMVRNDIPVAETFLKTYLQQAPTDVAAIRMLAEVAMRCDRDGDAVKLLERCLELAPNFAAARYHYAILLHRTNDPRRALAEIERLLTVEPRNPAYRNLCAVILSRIGEYARSSRIYAQLLTEYPSNSKAWLSYGHVLKTEGRTQECIDAYRKSASCEPSFGEPYWSLANLKTFRFEPADFAAMDARLGEAKLTDADRVHFHFALGKAYEDAHDYPRSFEHYARANALHHATLRYEADLNTQRMRRMKTTFAPEFFRERAGSGCQTTEPVFIVGMPRAGSTLIEQILSSHSAVEGTAELPEIITLARGLRALAETEGIGSYIEVLAGMDGPALRELGERYLESTRIHRKTARPFFIDKMPNNFLHIGLIQLVLPRAKIIDARRHPLACCFSNFKQHYAKGQRFSYGLSDIGRYYRDYVELMAHFDEVLPGRIHRIFYERMVEDTEAEVRRLLDFCGLPFEESCLRFFENERPVQTASSEQVRQPIYREGMDHWRHFDEWLGPLKTTLGPVLEAYPGVPRFD